MINPQAADSFNIISPRTVRAGTLVDESITKQRSFYKSRVDIGKNPCPRSEDERKT